MSGENIEQVISSTSNVIRHHCKVCNRGFGCAGALGGHMRAHVMGDVSDVNLSMKNGSNNKHSYFLRAKTPRAHMPLDHVMTDEDGYKKSLSASSLGPGFGLDHIEKVSNFGNICPNSNEDEDLANCLVMLSSNKKGPKEVVDNNTKGIFQCKACKKVFNSHQALGGHRASHKKVKGCFAAKLDDDEDENHMDGGDSIQEDHHQQHQEYYSYSLDTPPSESKNAPKMHECSVCRRVFTSGQALGGHKRCHWLTTSTSDTNGFNIPSFQYDHQLLYKKPMFTNPSHDQQLDLNLNLVGHNIESHAKGDIHEMNTQKCTTNLKQQENSEMKLRQLSDLRDLNLDGGWLQMGIASTNDITYIS